MRNTLIAAAAAAGFLTMGTIGASAAPVMPNHGLDPVRAAEHATIQQADWGWYCGPRCQYWRHRRWEEHHRWRDYHYGYNGYGYRYR